jgi:glycosyltransferase involved in cell wall biosynthesis
MRVLLLNQAYFPDVAATAQMAHDLARHLVQCGHQVQVVASRAIYGQRGGKLPRYERVDGADVHRVGVSLFGKKSTLARLIDFALFYVLAGIKCFTMPRPDVVVAFTTPPLIAAVGVMLRRLRGCKYVYWVMDLYPDVMVAYGMQREGSLAHRVLEGVSVWCLRRADQVVVLGRDMERRIVAKGRGIAAARVAVLPVWADAAAVTPMPPEASSIRASWNVGGRCVVMYSGNFGLAHDIDTLIGAIEHFREHGRDAVRFVFVGGGKRMEALQRQAQQSGWDHVRFEPYQPREKLGELLAAGDVHLISQADAMCGLLVPSKLYGIMAAGRPAVFVGPAEAEVALTLAQHECGERVAVGDTAGLVKVIGRLAQDASRREALGTAARQALEQHYSASLMCGRWERMLAGLVAGAGGGRGAAGG